MSQSLFVMLETPSSLVNSHQFPVFFNTSAAPWGPITFVAGEGDSGVGRDFQHAGEAAHIEPSHATTVPGLPHAVLRSGRSQVLNWVFRTGRTWRKTIENDPTSYFLSEVVLSSKFFRYLEINGVHTHLIPK